jgi:predicted nucleotidyltransferase
MDVVEALRGAAGEVFADQPVVFAYLFGSHARGTARPNSDIDVAVHVDDGVADATYLELSLTLAGKLASRAGVGPIDGVVVLNGAPLRLVGRVLSERRVIYSRDEGARVCYEVRMRALALDFEPRASALDRQLLARMAAGDA